MTERRDGNTGDLTFGETLAQAGLEALLREDQRVSEALRRVDGVFPDIPELAEVAACRELPAPAQVASESELAQRAITRIVTSRT